MALVINQEITNAGGTISFDPQSWGGTDAIIYLYVSSPVTLAANVDIQFSTAINEGTTLRILFDGGLGSIDLNGNTFSIDGANNFPQWLLDTPFLYTNTRLDGANRIQVYTDIFYCQGVDGDDLLLDESVPLDKLADLTSARIIVGNSSNRPTEVAMSGDATISNTGALTIANSAITNAKVDAAAAIARTKLASGSASHVLINDGSGVMTSEATLAKTRGGFGQDVSAANGFVTFAAGTLAIAAISEVITLDVTFEAAGGTVPSVGDFKVKMPYAGTVTEIYAYATKAIAATDNGTITPKNNGGTTMTSGVITFTASDARGTAYTSTPSANNTFAAGDILTFTTAKATAGGCVSLSIKITRTA